MRSSFVLNYELTKCFIYKPINLHLDKFPVAFFFFFFKKKYRMNFYSIAVHYYHFFVYFAHFRNCLSPGSEMVVRGCNYSMSLKIRIDKPLVLKMHLISVLCWLGITCSSYIFSKDVLYSALSSAIIVCVPSIHF